MKSHGHGRFCRWCSVFNRHLALSPPLTAPADLFQSKCQFESKSKGMAMAAFAVGARFSTGT